MTTPYVIGIGNAVMDVIAPASDASLNRLGIEKGIMQLIDRERSEFLMAAQSAETEAQKARLIPGGSVANTLAGIGAMGRAAGTGRGARGGGNIPRSLAPVPEPGKAGFYPSPGRSRPFRRFCCSLTSFRHRRGFP